MYDKTVLVTGSSRGIGYETAKLFAENNYNVIINYFNSEKKVQSIMADFEKNGYSVMACRADVSDSKQTQLMIKKGLSRFGGIDVLVNNAGISKQQLFTDITEADWDKMMNVNVKGMFNCCKGVLPYMINQKKGKIINISSIWGITGGSCEVSYSASKAAVIGFTKALAKELGPSNIQVNCVAPGIINTSMNSFLNEDEANELKDCTPLERFGEPIEIAESIFFLASDKADFITGQVLSPNGGFVI